MKRLLFPVILAITATSAPVYADDISVVLITLQSDFKKLSEDLSSALSYKAVTPAEPLGLTGFDIGIEATGTKLANPEVLDTAMGGDGPTTLVVPKLHIHKGLPLGFDIGAFYSKVPSTGISLVGAEIRYAIMEGGIAMPALGLRGAYSKLSGVEDLEFDSKSVELSISKGFAFFTPYAGVGRVMSTSTPASSTGLDEEEITQSKVFAGANFNFAFINFDLEADKTGEATTYGAKMGWRF